MSRKLLPPSLKSEPNIPWEKQTVEQLRAERDYWQSRIDKAEGWGASLAVAAEYRDACEAWLKRRLSEPKESEMEKKPRGFAAISPERQREIASMGGRAVPAEKRSYSQNRELAATAGSKGGKSIAPEKRSFSKDRNLASESGRKGGKATARSRAPKGVTRV